MNKLHISIIITFFVCLATSNIFGRPQTPQLQLFHAEDGSMGKYWAGTNKNSGKAYVAEDKYINVISIKKSQLNKTVSKKLRKGKNYLGLYINEKSGNEYYVYGEKKNLEPVDDSPDADVITVIAIKEDYGIGE